MFDLARHIPVWMLSYNDKVVDLETLAALVKAVDPSRAVQASAQTYAHMPHVAKRQNQELLIIAVKG
jgi:thiamine kinase-like enzyme